VTVGFSKEAGILIDYNERCRYQWKKNIQETDRNCETPITEVAGIILV
jgi:hypothetical protein